MSVEDISYHGGIIPYINNSIRDSYLKGYKIDRLKIELTSDVYRERVVGDLLSRMEFRHGLEYVTGIKSFISFVGGYNETSLILKVRDVFERHVADLVSCGNHVYLVCEVSIENSLSNRESRKLQKIQFRMEGPLSNSIWRELEN
jgi:hypothetical protein